MYLFAPSGAIMEALPSSDEITRRVEKVLSRHFSKQVRIIEANQEGLNIFQLDSFDLVTALDSLQQIMVDLTASFDEIQGRELGDKAMQTIKELLLEGIKLVKKQAELSVGLQDFLKKIGMEVGFSSLIDWFIDTLIIWLIK